MSRTFRIGTRGSELALVQARWVAARLEEHGVASEIAIIRTEGDDRPVDTAWGEGAFVGRIVAALLDGTVDLAVHSAKDVPTTEPDRLVIAAYPRREDPRDALVCRVRGTTLETLPVGARVGTDSPRRVAFLRAIRPDLDLHPLHGNVDTRLAKLDRGDTDALVLAVAGLARLGRAERIDDILPEDAVPSAPGQGSLALQVRAGDAEAIAAVGLLDDADTRVAVEAERALLAGTGGGCRSPIGAIGTVRDGRLEMLAGAERTWTPGEDAAITVSRVAWVRGDATAADRAHLSTRLARRIVALRTRPRALVARPVGQAEAMVVALDAAGVEPVHVPAIEIRAAAPGGAFDTAVARVAAGDIVVVTSANAARAMLRAATRMDLAPAVLVWAAVGEATAAVLADAGLEGVFIPTEANALTLARELPIRPHDRVLVPHADIADRALAETLRARGATVTDVVAYETAEAPETSRPLLAAALDDGPLDVLVLTSGSTARGLRALASAEALPRLLATPVITGGPATFAVARELGFETVLQAPSPGALALATFTAAALGVVAPDPRPTPAGETR
ncbi:MAG: hydroxymethylbilane synthase [Chloroflexi bacterium]|nr:hydroxymethylbilane synthase [Chloroflexota bacterium]